MKNNPEKKFEEIYKLYFKHVFNFAYKRIPYNQDVEDIVSEVFIAIWQNINNLDENKNIKSFIFTISKNKINDYLRKHYKIESKKDQIEDEDIFFEAEDRLDEINKNLKDKKLKIVSEIFELLNYKDQEFFKLRYFDKLTFKEISIKLNITLNNTKVKNNRLIKKIKKIWEQKN